MQAILGGQLGWLATAPQRGLPSDLLSSGLIAAGVMMLVWLLLRMQWRRQVGARAQRTPLEHLTGGREPAQPAAERWVRSNAGATRRDEEAGAELVQLARRILAQIEVRSTQLETLIADADERIAELRQLQAGPERPRRPTGPQPADPDRPSASRPADRQAGSP